MVRLSKVDQLEIKREGAAELVGVIDGHGIDGKNRELHQVFGLANSPFCLQLAATDGGLAQLLDFLVELVAGLLAEHAPEQQPQRAHVAAQRGFLQIAGARFEFSEALGPDLGFPQRRHLF